MLIGINANLAMNETGYAVEKARISFILSGVDQSLLFQKGSTPTNPHAAKSFSGNIYEIAIAIGRKAISMAEPPAGGEEMHLQAFRILIDTDNTGRFVTTIKVFSNIEDRELSVQMTPRDCVEPTPGQYPPGTIGFNVISAMKCMAAAAINV